MKFTKTRYITLIISLNNETCTNIKNTLNDLTAKLVYTDNLVQMSKFIIEKHEGEISDDAVNWLYGNMKLIEDLNLLGEVVELTNHLTDHMGDTVVSDATEDDDLPF